MLDFSAKNVNSTAPNWFGHVNCVATNQIRDKTAKLKAQNCPFASHATVIVLVYARARLALFRGA